MPVQLIDHGTPNLSVTTNDEVIANFFDANVVYHGSPGLHSLPLENRDRDPFCDPDLKSEHPRIDEDGEEFRGVAHMPDFDGMGMNHPEKRILPTEPFQPAVNQNTDHTEPGEYHYRQPQPADE